MRIPLLLAALLALASPLALADEPPADATPFKLIEGESKPLNANNGSQVVCDDPSIARSDVVEDRLVLVGVHAGKTTCAVRFAGALTRAVYAVTVVVPPPPEKK